MISIFLWTNAHLIGGMRRAKGYVEVGFHLMSVPLQRFGKREKPRMRTISTIGYEGCDIGHFIGTLTDSGIVHVLDIRDRALSRKPGFSKTALTMALTEASISYSHLQPLGDPKPGRDAMRAGRREEFEAIFSAHLERPEAQLSMRQAISVASDAPSVLLCYESDHRCCHRLVVAERMAKAGGLSIRHLTAGCEMVPRGRARDAGTYAFG